MSESTAPQPSAACPIPELERIASLDVLRGVAVLGILVMNIRSYSMIGQAYFNPTAWGDLTGINLWLWRVSEFLAAGKFYTIFAMLFGAGVVVLTSRVEARGRSACGLHYRRVLWLIVFGLLHAHLLWYGDILYAYGMCGLIVYWFRRLRPGRLFGIGGVLIAIPFLINLALGALAMLQEVDTQQQGQAMADFAAREVEAFRGSWMDQMPVRVQGAIWIETYRFFIFGWWKTTALMLWGMAMFKLGVFSARRSRLFYWGWIVAAVLIGLPLIWCGIEAAFAADWRPGYVRYFGQAFNYWASIIVAMGWVGVVMLACRSELLRPLTKPFAAVGRMAFTNYIIHTVICTTIFYGHGFGQFGHFERWQQSLVVLGVWAFQLIASPIWLHYFRFGPMEWLWRSLSYWRLQPMRRTDPPSSLSTA